MLPREFEARRSEQPKINCTRMAPRLAAFFWLIEFHPKAFPSISTGIYGYPIRAATHIALDTSLQFLQSPSGETVCFLPQLYPSHAIIRSMPGAHIYKSTDRAIDLCYIFRL